MTTIFNVDKKESCILHCDLNNFYASVECLLNPCLKGYCVAVTGDQDMRHGIVLAKSNEAKAMGVKTAEAIWQARKKCPDLICVPPHYNAYVEYSKKVKEIYARYSDRVEAFSLDECWIDVTDTLPLLGKDGKQTADEIRETVKKETGLTISVGVSFTKSFAKLGSDMKKPDATTVITKENFRKTVWNLDVADMIMIGRKTAEKLNKYNIFTIGQLAKADDWLMKDLFGVNGIKILDAANGRDFTPVALSHEERDIKSVGHGTTAAKDVGTYEDASNIIYFLCEMISTRMRRYKVKGKTHAEAQFRHQRYRQSGGRAAQRKLASRQRFAAAHHYGSGFGAGKQRRRRTAGLFIRRRQEGGKTRKRRGHDKRKIRLRRHFARELFRL